MHHRTLARVNLYTHQKYSCDDVLSYLNGGAAKNTAQLRHHSGICTLSYLRSLFSRRGQGWCTYSVSVAGVRILSPLPVYVFCLRYRCAYSVFFTSVSILSPLPVYPCSLSVLTIFGSFSTDFTTSFTNPHVFTASACL